MKTIAFTTAAATVAIALVIGCTGEGRTLYTLTSLALVVIGWLELMVASRAGLLPPAVSDFFKEAFYFGEYDTEEEERREKEQTADKK